MVSRVVESEAAVPAARRKPTRRVLVLLSLGLCLLIIAYLLLGPVSFSPASVFRALVNRPDELHHRISVWEVRLPRVLIAAIAGAMLASAGAFFQSVLRNPLAAPATVGVTQGAVLGAVLGLTVTFGTEGALDGINAVVSVTAILGGVVVGGLVYLLSYRRAGTDPVRLILTGVVVAAAASSATSFLVLAAGSHADSIVRWIVGSLTTRTWEHVAFLLPVAAIAFPVAVFAVPLANALQLGDSTSTNLGLRTELVRVLILVAAVVLAAGAVSVVGGIAFVGLIGPHLARSLVGSDLRRLLVASALVGAILLVGADLLARVFSLDWIPFVDIETETGTRIPVGAFTALIGAPFFLYLMRERMR